ncbi:MAG TPA: SPOR domain-containing protein, partial [Stellaceae bacterium]|nr:SPOR domain-containing protein [Stellaceae bacterium]
AYYTLLRSMDDLGRTAAILGADIRATKFNEPAAIIKDSIIGEAPKAAPMTPVQGQALPTPAAAAQSDSDSSAVINLSVAKVTPAVQAPAAAPSPMPAAKTSAPAKATAAPVVAPAAAAPVAPAVAALPQPTPAPQIAEPAKAQAEAPKPEPTAPQASVTLIGAPSPAAEPTSPIAAANDNGKHLVVQIASFQSESIARKLSDELTAKGMGSLAVVHDQDKDGRDWYAVRTAEFASAQAAESAAQSLRNNGAFGAVVLRVAGTQRSDDVASAQHD